MAGSFRRIIRASRVITDAADLLDSMAQSIFDCETVEGEWAFGSDEDKELHDKARKTATALRELVTRKDEATHVS